MYQPHVFQIKLQISFKNFFYKKHKFLFQVQICKQIIAKVIRANDY